MYLPCPNVRIDAKHPLISEQWVVITGLGGEAFSRACSAIDTIASIFDKQFQEGSVLVRCQTNTGSFPALRFGNRLLSRGGLDNGESHPTDVDIDPNGILAAIGRGTFMHTDDNAVAYNERIIKDSE